MVRERDQEAEPDYANAGWFLMIMDPLMSYHVLFSPSIIYLFFLKKTSQIRKQKFLKYGFMGNCATWVYIINKGQKNLGVFP